LQVIANTGIYVESNLSDGIINSSSKLRKSPGRFLNKASELKEVCCLLKETLLKEFSLAVYWISFMISIHVSSMLTSWIVWFYIKETVCPSTLIISSLSS